MSTAFWIFFLKSVSKPLPIFEKRDAVRKSHAHHDVLFGKLILCQIFFNGGKALLALIAGEVIIQKVSVGVTLSAYA